MDQSGITSNKYSTPFLKKVKNKVFRWMRLTNRPVVKVYNGYGSEKELVVFGHVLSLSPLPRKKFRKNIWTNTLSLIRLFMVTPMPSVKVELHFSGEVITGITDTDGFYYFQWHPLSVPVKGWNQVQVVLAEGQTHNYHGIIKGTGELFVPFDVRYAIISDIDDTFLISYSSNLWKRLYVLFTENAHSRRPFDGVVRHYQALEFAGTDREHPNPFFYVSSSEWNLYNYITDFSWKNDLPKGIYLLNHLKSLSEIAKTGHNNHSAKFMRISRILQAYPEQQFILLGDDSQQDPFIYASVTEQFSLQIRAVYLRNVFYKNTNAVNAAIARIRQAGVPVCHFQHSKEALEHSSSAGLI